MTTGWSVFVIVLVTANILACLWLIMWTAKRREGEEAEGAEKDHVWDEDLRELNNPMPRWWLNLFVLTIVFGFGYFALYPGLGAFAGVLGWSQASEHDAAISKIHSRREAHLRSFADQDIEVLAGDVSAAQVGARLYVARCAGCHGADARGAIGFPNLTDDDWLYGGTPQAIAASIVQGRNGVMPPFHAVLDPSLADDLVRLVAHWSAPNLPPARLAAAQAQFARTCAACHGADGGGNQMLGAPRLNDAIWLHGGAEEAIRQTIMFGRQSAMPAHAQELSEAEVKLLTAYVYRLSAQAD